MMQEEAGQKIDVWWNNNSLQCSNSQLLLDTKPEPTDEKEEKGIQA